MGDNRQWFKVWTSILTDTKMQNFHNQTLGIWVRLGALVAQQGINGTVSLSRRQFLYSMHLDGADDVTVCGILEEVKKLNITIVQRDDMYTVTFTKWHKYQVDNSSERTAKWRKNVTIQEEKRREENKKREEPKDIGTRKKRESFKPPLLEDVKRYCLEKGFVAFDCEKFHAYYESNGWRVGKNPMKSWQSAITTWRKNDNGSKNGGSGRLRSFAIDDAEARAKYTRERREKLCPGSVGIFGSIHREKASEGRDRVVDSEAIEVPEEEITET